MEKVVVSLPLIMLVCHGVMAEQFCYAEDPNPYLRFAARTDPRVIRGEDDGTAVQPESECEPIQIWSVARPGATWPSRHILKKLVTLHKLKQDIVRNHEQGKGKLCKKDIENLKMSKFPPESAVAGTLAEQGFQDMEDFGKSLKDRFPSLLLKEHKPENYEFRYTDQPHVRQNVQAFARGLFGEDYDRFRPDLKPPAQELFLNTPDNCDKWRTEVIEARAAERGAFDKSEHIQTLIQQVSDRLGFQDPLGIGPVILMYQGCSLEKATQSGALPSWCAVFTASELKILEYREDMMYFQSCGPGENAPLANQLSCPLVNDMLDRFRSIERGETEPPAVFYFTDEKSLLVLLQGLGLVGISLANVNEMEERNYRSSVLVPFAGNFIAVLYRCPKVEGLRVGLYLNGRPVHGDRLRSWRLLYQELYSYYVRSYECTVDYCKVDGFSVVDCLKVVANSGVVLTLAGALMALTPVRA